MSREELERLWADPKNWGWAYQCALDPRVIVPRRRRWMGWTINFAHPWAWPVLLVGSLVAVGPVLLLLWLGWASERAFVLSVTGSVCLLAALSHWEASRSREH